MDLLLGVLYFPFFVFCFLSGMAIEGVMTQTDPAVIFTAYVIGYTGPLISVLTYPCLFLSVNLREKGNRKAARWLRFAPPLTMAAIWGICALVETIF